MNYFELLSETSRQNPQRSPGSPGAGAVMEALKAMAAGFNLHTQADQFPVFRFQASLWIWTAIGWLCFGAGYAFAPVSLVGALLLLFLLSRELTSPLLGKLAPGAARNFTITLPAKNKEAQKIFLIASYDTQSLLESPGSFRPGSYLLLLYGLAGGMVLTSAVYLLTQLSLYNHLNLLLLLVITVLNGSAKNREIASDLKSCAALLETATLLEKVKPSITSVTFCFCGAHSLNSGILALAPEFAKGPKELTYVVNLTDTADPSITGLRVMTSEGLLPAKNADMAAVSLIKEVAQEKSLGMEAAPTTEYMATYPLNRSKVNPVSLLIPQSDAISVREIRELLCGLIRKLDH